MGVRPNRFDRFRRLWVPQCLLRIRLECGPKCILQPGSRLHDPRNPKVLLFVNRGFICRAYIQHSTTLLLGCGGGKPYKTGEGENVNSSDEKRNGVV